MSRMRWLNEWDVVVKWVGCGQVRSDVVEQGGWWQNGWDVMAKLAGCGG
jgi:hypothetical protein